MLVSGREDATQLVCVREGSLSQNVWKDFDRIFSVETWTSNQVIRLWPSQREGCPGVNNSRPEVRSCYARVRGLRLLDTAYNSYCLIETKPATFVTNLSRVWAGFYGLTTGQNFGGQIFGSTSTLRGTVYTGSSTVLKAGSN